jgi:ATP-dependent helicase/nuclease subunit B
VTPEQKAAALARLDQVFGRVAGRFEDELAPRAGRVWQAAISAVRSDLREWLRRTSEEGEWLPAHFELSFGLSEPRERDPKSTDAPVALDCGLLLRGSIDLVERSVRGTLRATDHKSGKPRASEGTVIGGGETLQPVLYALTLEKLFPGERVEGGRLYYCTSAAGFSAVTIPLDGRAREAAHLLARTLSSAIDQGFLPAAPAPRACEYCDYLAVCGPYEELRTGRKNKGALRALTLLRGSA